MVETNKVLRNDFEIIAQSNINFEKLHNATVLITGATGFIGSLLIKAILYCCKKHRVNVRILALVRDVQKASNLFSACLSDHKIEFVVCDLAKDEIKVEGKVDYIIHAASVTASKIMIENPVDVIKISVNGTEKILQLAVEKNAKSVVYLSSMEAYGSVYEKADETKLGYVDLTSVRSCYPESKRLCECLCTAYSSQYALNIKVARLAQTFGAGILPNENRVFAQFAKSVIRQTDIVLHTNGESEGNYVYSSDAVTALLLLLLSDATGTFNVSNEACHMTIAEMAKLVCAEIAGDHIKVVFDIPEQNNYGYAPATKLFLDSTKMQSLGWVAQVGMAEAYRRLIEYLVDEE